MSNPENSLSRILHAIADPTRRQILQALKERKACSIGKEVGLCACDIEQRVQVEAEKQGQWMWYRRNEVMLREFARTLRQSL